MTLLYGALFLMSGAALLMIASGVVVRSSSKEAVSRVMAAVSAVLGWLMAGHALRPLRTITATVRRISEDNLHERLAFDGPREELRDLADTFDGLLEWLETAFAR